MRGCRLAVNAMRGKMRGHFPNDEAAIKPLWPALRNVPAKTVRSAFDWKSAK
jgi:transposase-like protein